MLCLGVQGTCKSLPNSEISIRTRHCLNSQTKCNTRLQAPLSLANCLGPFRRSSTAGLQPAWKTHGQYLHLDVQGPPSPKFMNENWPLSLEDAGGKGGVLARHYNGERSHSALENLCPREFGAFAPHGGLTLKIRSKAGKEYGARPLGPCCQFSRCVPIPCLARSSIDQTAGEV